MDTHSTAPDEPDRRVRITDRPLRALFGQPDIDIAVDTPDLTAEQFAAEQRLRAERERWAE